MNAVELHLILNHIPLFTTLFGLIFVLLGIKPNFKLLERAGMLLLILGGLSVIPVYLTGEEAEEVIEEYHVFSGDQIHEHEEAGERARTVSIILGIFALITFLADQRGMAFSVYTKYATIFLGLLALFMLGYAGYEGGKISHPEAHGNFEAVQKQSEQLPSSKSSHSDDD